MAELLPVGTVVRVTPSMITWLDGGLTRAQPYNAIVRGYDTGHTKYWVSPELWADSGQFMERGLYWPFPHEVSPAGD